MSYKDEVLEGREKDIEQMYLLLNRLVTDDYDAWLKNGKSATEMFQFIESTGEVISDFVYEINKSINGDEN